MPSEHTRTEEEKYLEIDKTSGVNRKIVFNKLLSILFTSYNSPFS